MITISFAAPLAAVAVKLAAEDSGKILANGGTVTAELLLDRVITPPCVCGSSTVHVLDPPAGICEGAHDIEGTPPAVVRVIKAACHELLSVALIIAVWSAAITSAVAVNVCTVEPEGAVTDAGMLKAALSDARLTVAPCVVESVTLQSAEPPGPRVVGVQLNDVTRIGSVSCIGTVRDDPFSDAVTVAFSSAEMIPTVTTNVAVVEPEATAADDGAVKEGLLVARTTVPPLFLDSVTVQVALPPGCKVADEHVRDMIVSGVVNAMDVVREEPLNDAVMVAVWSAVMTPVIAVKVAVVEPAGTDTDPGTVSAV
jgi:hypothetical protein